MGRGCTVTVATSGVGRGGGACCWLSQLIINRPDIKNVAHRAIEIKWLRSLIKNFFLPVQAVLVAGKII
jgi:hypothetical protein